MSPPAPWEGPAAERLRRIEAVTDSALAHLDVEDLLDELLERVRDLLEVDTAVVLLLDESGTELVATAALGVEDEVRLGVRVVVGHGFAGTIAAELVPKTIEHVDAGNVTNPVLLDRGVRSLLGAPLVASGELIGVIHVGSLTTRRFSDHDIELLQVVADRIALAADARRANVERAAAAALQRSLIPATLPAVTGLELAARYLPGEEGGVGGDWYDVFVLPSGEVGLVIGDVVGRGLGAAVVMGRLRSALRAYALEADDPADVLERLDRKVHHFEAGHMTTVLYGALDPEVGRLRLSSAGHLLPVLAAPGEASTYLDAAVDPPLGFEPGTRRHTTEVEIPPGGVVCLFTDGLVERRDVPLDDKLEQLRTVVRAIPPTLGCRAVIAELLDQTGPPDDVAVLMARRSAPS